jgi:hypothetical protein
MRRACVQVCRREFVCEQYVFHEHVFVQRFHVADQCSHRYSSRRTILLIVAGAATDVRCYCFLSVALKGACALRAWLPHRTAITVLLVRVGGLARLQCFGCVAQRSLPALLMRVCSTLLRSCVRLVVPAVSRLGMLGRPRRYAESQFLSRRQVVFYFSVSGLFSSVLCIFAAISYCTFSPAFSFGACFCVARGVY